MLFYVGVTDVGCAAAPQEECWHSHKTRGQEVILVTEYPAGGGTSTFCHYLLTLVLFKIHFFIQYNKKGDILGELSLKNC